MTPSDKDKIYFPLFACSLMLLAIDVYWHCFMLFPEGGMAYEVAKRMLGMLASTGLLASPWKIKAFTLLLVLSAFIVKTGKSTRTSWSTILITEGTGLALFFGGALVHWPFFYAVLAIAGFVVLCVGTALMGRKFTNFEQEDNDIYETFQQCEELIDTDDSVNLKFSYQYQKKKHTGYINVVSAQRGSMIVGLPGCGKTYSFFYTFLRDQIRKHHAMFVYDFKMPDLSKSVYNFYLQTYEFAKEKVETYRSHDPAAIKEFELRHRNDEVKTPLFCLINFDNPRQTMRCNPLNARYLTDMSDAHEVADLIMKNTNRNAIENEDFFVMSAKIIIAGSIWQLKKYKGGIYCTFPHLIEMLGLNYKALFQVLQQDKEIRVLIQPFEDALKGHAQEQLQGQLASARMPLLRFPSAAFYWVLSGDDFTLDINNPDSPKLLCVGNNPDRQSVYGTALALYTSRVIKIINHKTNAEGKRNVPCGFHMDEFPTLYCNGIDNLIATARSNNVKVCLGIQDLSQLKSNYGDKEAAKIFNTVGNIFSGQVNGETAKHMSEMFGREFRQQQSETVGTGSDSVSTSFQQREILPQSRIETLSQGYFFGKVADDREHPIERKLFCGKILIDTKQREEEEKSWEELPNFGESYFHDREIEEQVRQNPEKAIKQYLIARKEQEELERSQRDPYYIRVGKSAIVSLVQAEYAKMSEEDRDRILGKAVKKAQDRNMNEIMERNADIIRMQVRSMFEDYGIDLEALDKEDEKKKGKNGGAEPGKTGGSLFATFADSRDETDTDEEM